MKIIFSIFLLTIISPLVALDLSQANQFNGALSQKPSVPVEFRSAIEFLDFIKVTSTGESMYTTKQAPIWDVNQFMTFISSTGVMFTDVNENGEMGWEVLKGHFSFQEIRSQIEKADGRIYGNFFWLGGASASPRVMLKCEKLDDKYIVLVNDDWKLTFVPEKGKLRLVQSDFLVISEGEMGGR